METGTNILVNKTLAKSIGLPAAALFGYYMKCFEHCMENQPENNGWFVRTHGEISKEINLPVNTVKRLKQRLISVGLLKAEMGGYPIREWLTVDVSKLMKMIEPGGAYND